MSCIGLMIRLASTPACSKLTTCIAIFLKLQQPQYQQVKYSHEHNLYLLVLIPLTVKIFTVEV